MSRQQAGARGAASGTAGGNPALSVPVSAAVQRQRELRQRVDKDVAAMVENFNKMVATAKVHDTLLRNSQEGFQAAVHAAKLVQAAESLLKLVGELKQHALFTNLAALNQAVDAQREEFTSLTRDTDRVLDAVAQDAALLLGDIEQLRYSSSVGPRDDPPPAGLLNVV